MHDDALQDFGVLRRTYQLKPMQAANSARMEISNLLTIRSNHQQAQSKPKADQD